MSESVLEAIRRGVFDFEPDKTGGEKYDKTKAMPGSREKLSVLADRIQQGLPLWHPDDRVSYDEDEG